MWEWGIGVGGVRDHQEPGLSLPVLTVQPQSHAELVLTAPAHVFDMRTLSRIMKKSEEKYPVRTDGRFPPDKNTIQSFTFLLSTFTSSLLFFCFSMP